MSRPMTPYARAWPTPEHCLRPMAGQVWTNSGITVTVTGGFHACEVMGAGVDWETDGPYKLHQQPDGQVSNAFYVSGPTGWERPAIDVSRPGWTEDAEQVPPRRVWVAKIHGYSLTVISKGGPVQWLGPGESGGAEYGPFPVLRAMLAAEKCAAEAAAKAEG